MAATLARSVFAEYVTESRLCDYTELKLVKEAIYKVVDIVVIYLVESIEELRKIHEEVYAVVNKHDSSFHISRDVLYVSPRILEDKLEVIEHVSATEHDLEAVCLSESEHAVHIVYAGDFNVRASSYLSVSREDAESLMMLCMLLDLPVRVLVQEIPAGIAESRLLLRRRLQVEIRLSSEILLDLARRIGRAHRLADYTFTSSC